MCCAGMQIIMGTFVLAFIGNGFVRSAEDTVVLRLLPTPWRRRSLVATYFLSIVSLLIIFGVMTIPDIIREGADFIQRLKSDNIWVVVLDKMRHGLGWVPSPLFPIILSLPSSPPRVPGFAVTLLTRGEGAGGGKQEPLLPPTYGLPPVFDYGCVNTSSCSCNPGTIS